MPFFLPGDWIRRPKHYTRYRVLRVLPNGHIYARDPTGQIHLLTRPEQYRKTEPPNTESTKTQFTAQ